MARRRRADGAVIAPPRSLYRKMQIVLAEARKHKTASIDELVKTIKQRGHLDFTCYRIGGDGVAEPVPCSPAAVLRVVMFCADLGLIDRDSSELTKPGIRAAEGQKFDEVMQRLLKDALKQFGAPLDEVKRVIAALFASCKAGSLPTWDVIYEHLGLPDAAKDRTLFRTYLSLLYACHGVECSRKKLYLP